MLYCSNVFVGMTQLKKQRFETFQDRAMHIISGKRKSDVKLPWVNHIQNRLYAFKVFKLLNGIVLKAFGNYFTRHTNVVMSKIRTETGCKTFLFQGAKIFNNLSDGLQTEKSLLILKASSKGINLDFCDFYIVIFNLAHFFSFILDF